MVTANSGYADFFDRRRLEAPPVTICQILSLADVNFRNIGRLASRVRWSHWRAKFARLRCLPEVKSTHVEQVAKTIGLFADVEDWRVFDELRCVIHE